MFVSGASQLDLDGEIFIFKSRRGLFTSHMQIERNGMSVASAKFPFPGSRCQITYEDHKLERELTLRISNRHLRGTQFRLCDSGGEIGKVEHNRDEAILDLPKDIPLPVQVFIFRLARMLWERAD